MIGQVFDIEADGLHPTKIHCLSIALNNNEASSLVSYDDMREFLLNAEVLVGHNIQRYDIPNLERLLDIKIKARLIDTLALSWYLEPLRIRHGLEEYGEEFGVPKPKIDDWENLAIEEYCHRCEEDTKINLRLWQRQWRQLVNIYESEDEVLRFLDYIEFKMDCARDQEKHRWKLDVDKCNDVLEVLYRERDKRTVELAKAMPKVPVYGDRKRPAKPYKKNGDLSEHGKSWFELLRNENLPEDFEGVVKYVKDWEEPNPGSHPQIKNWLYSLGWEPITFNYKRDKVTGEVTKIPQVQQDKTLGPGLCESVKKLISKEPAIEAFEGLAIVTHRIGIIEGFLNNVDQDGYVQAQVQGLTNTLRFKHKVVVNLPGVDKPYGADIRGCLIAPEGYELAGSDMSGLEDRTGRHYMFDYDPEYVEAMNQPGFDPHLDLANKAGRVEDNNVIKYINADDDFKHTRLYESIKALRRVFKTVNYAGKYGAGPPKLSLTLGCSLTEAKSLHEVYWQRNWSVKAVADACEIKVANGLMWLYNPVSKFWLSLRHEKDRFSTLNQSTGVYCFDTWVRKLRKNGPPIIAQMHDEVVMLVKKGIRERLKNYVYKCMDETNEELKLNVSLECSLDFGENYASIH